MRRDLPPFPALRAFEAAARLGSFRAAADELCVTPSAVSHQVRKLEEHLGLRLYDRTDGGPVLTAKGRDYLGRVGPLLDALEAETDALFFRRRGDCGLSVRGTPAFIARWLIPRLDRIRADTGLTLRLSAGPPPTDFAAHGSDVIIHWGAGPVPGAVVEPFLATPKILVASPGYLARHGTPRSPADLAGATLLRDEVRDCWDEWLALAGAPAGLTADGPAFAHCEMVLAAVERDQGFALAYAALVEDDLARGRLLRPLPQATEEKLIYSVAYPESQRHNRRVRALADWIHAEMGDAGLAARSA